MTGSGLLKLHARFSNLVHTINRPLQTSVQVLFTTCVCVRDFKVRLAALFKYSFNLQFFMHYIIFNSLSANII